MERSMHLFYVHWNQQEITERIAPLQQAGHTVTAHCNQKQKPQWGEQLPDVFIFSLDRLPSHSKAIAQWVWEAKKRQHIPIVFEGGKEEKIALLQQKFPRAIFVKAGKVQEVLSGLSFSPDC